MDIQWFPGHMNRALRQIKDDIKAVDFVVELLDARIPYSSSNPELDRLIPHSKKIIALNKRDLADTGCTMRWIEHFKRRSIPAMAIDSVKGGGIGELLKKIDTLGMDMRKRLRRRGRRARPVRVMIVGIPNVGKSSLINKIVGRTSAKTGNKPGVTKGRQWIRIAESIDLLDTPGVLWPKFKEKVIGVNLALTGSIKPELLNTENLALKLIKKIVGFNPVILEEGYGIPKSTDAPYEVLELIAKKRGCFIKGGKTDNLRAANILLEDFRRGRLGPVTLEVPGTNIK